MGVLMCTYSKEAVPHPPFYSRKARGEQVHVNTDAEWIALRRTAHPYLCRCLCPRFG